MNPERYDQLLDRLIDDPADAEAAAELNAALRDDTELRHHHLSAVSLHDALDAELGETHDLARLRQRTERIGRADRRRMATSSLLAAAASLLFALVVFHFIQSSRHDVASVTPGTEAVFAIDRQGRSSGLRPGDAIVAKSGRLRVDLETGVRAILEGPARIRLEKHGTVSLEAGRAWFDVTAPDAGFSVRTPFAHYRDIGTTFGITLLGDTEELSVATGAVEVAGVTVEAGEHLSVLPDGGTKHLSHPAARYAKSLTDPVKPHLRWSFDTPDPATATGTHPALGSLKARFAGEPIVIPDGKFGSAIRFHGTSAPLLTEWQGIGGAAPRTVAAWVRVSPGVPLDGTICMWGDPSEDAGINRKWKLTLNRQPVRGPYGALRLTTGSGHQIASSNLLDGEWHHVAVVLGTGWPRLFVNGREESGPNEISLPIDTAPDGLPFSIGGPHHTSRPTGAAFTGDIDEFWVFDAALSSAEINKLYQENLPQ